MAFDMIDGVRKWLEQDGGIFLRSTGIKNGDIVLDFGCGEGNYVIPASKAVGGKGKIYALDKDSDALNNLKKLIQQYNIKNVHLLNENSKIPLGNNSIDVVLCYDVIHYGNRKERIAIYNEVNRVLDEQGLFSVYPKHNREDYPLMELADIDLESVIKEIEKSRFIIEQKLLKTLLHDDYYNEGYVLNFRKC